MRLDRFLELPGVEEFYKTAFICSNRPQEPRRPHAVHQHHCSYCHLHYRRRGRSPTHQPIGRVQAFQSWRRLCVRDSRTWINDSLLVLTILSIGIACFKRDEKGQGTSPCPVHNPAFVADYGRRQFRGRAAVLDPETVAPASHIRVMECTWSFNRDLHQIFTARMPTRGFGCRHIVEDQPLPFRKMVAPQPPPFDIRFRRSGAQADGSREPPNDSRGRIA